MKSTNYKFTITGTKNTASVRHGIMIKGTTREGAKGAEALPLNKSKLRKKNKILDSFDIFVSQ